MPVDIMKPGIAIGHKSPLGSSTRQHLATFVLPVSAGCWKRWSREMKQEVSGKLGAIHFFSLSSIFMG